MAISASGIVTALHRLGMGRRGKPSPPAAPASEDAGPISAGHAPASADMLCANEPYYEAIAAALRATGFLKS